MTSYPEALDELDTFEAVFGPPQLDPSTRRMLVPVVSLGASQLPFCPGAELCYVDRAFLCFEGVRASERAVQDYDATRRLREPIYSVVDLEPLASGAGDGAVYRLQGVEGPPPGRYVCDWRIHADRSSLLVPSDARTADAPFVLDDALRAFLTERGP